MTDEEQTQLRVESGEWLLKEITSLVEQYKACKTSHARVVLLPRLKYLVDKADFELREILK